MPLAAWAIHDVATYLPLAVHTTPNNCNMVPCFDLFWLSQCFSTFFNHGTLSWNHCIYGTYFMVSGHFPLPDFPPGWI